MALRITRPFTSRAIRLASTSATRAATDGMCRSPHRLLEVRVRAARPADVVMRGSLASEGGTLSMRVAGDTSTSSTLAWSTAANASSSKGVTSGSRRRCYRQLNEGREWAPESLPMTPRGPLVWCVALSCADARPVVAPVADTAVVAQVRRSATASPVRVEDDAAVCRLVDTGPGAQGRGPRQRNARWSGLLRRPRRRLGATTIVLFRRNDHGANMVATADGVVFRAVVDPAAVTALSVASHRGGRLLPAPAPPRESLALHRGGRRFRSCVHGARTAWLP